MKKVCMIVADHPFMDSRIFKKEAKSLQKKGYDVSMIVPRKNGYLFDVDGTPFTNRFLEKSFVYEGIKIITYNWENSRNQLNKVVNDVSTWDTSGAFYNPLTKLGIKQDADIYHVHEYLSLFAGIGIKRLMKTLKGKDVKLIYDSHELTPDPFDPRYSESHRNNLKEKLLYMLKETDYIITISDSIKSWYISQNPSLPVEVVYNSPPLALTYKQKNYNKNKLTACYEGNIDPNRGNTDKIFKMSEICAKNVDFKFKIIGGPRFGETIQLPDHLQKNIHLTGWVDFQEISKHMEEVDIGWIDYDNLNQSLNRHYAMPNKFFSFLNNGVPIIVNKCHDMESFLRRHQCGLVVNKQYSKGEDFAEALLYLYNNKDMLQKMSINARKAMEDLYSWEKMEQRLYNVYSELLGNNVKFLM
ncbi:glycosyltransferase [Metabacillus fastidiosus]|uniref:glycosyltransferase n=1 Tax=Metabacillus fastidiosus TaxID=1458 RepID=UPI003D28ED64